MGGFISADAVNFNDTIEILIADGTGYTFSAQVKTVPLDGDTLVSANEFKRVPGVAGFLQIERICSASQAVLPLLQEASEWPWITLNS